MALSIAAGLIFAMVLTLVLFPSMLVILNDIHLFVYRIGQGFWPRRVAVEPARHRETGLGYDASLPEPDTV